MLNLLAILATAFAMLPGGGTTTVEHGSHPALYAVPPADTCTITTPTTGDAHAVCTIDGTSPADWLGVFTFAPGTDPSAWTIDYLHDGAGRMTYTSGTWDGGPDVAHGVEQIATDAATSSGEACAAIDNRADAAAWARPGHAATGTTYTDNGELMFAHPVPRGASLEALKRATDSLGIGQPGPKLVVQCARL